METHIKNPFVLPVLIAALGLILAGRVTAQTFTTLHSFSAYPNYTNTDGANPNGFVLSGNILYGTAANGGSSQAGTMFKVNTDGTGFTNLHSFVGFPSDGANPFGGLILSGDTLYGTALYGGTSGNGTVFAVNMDGTGFTNLHSFTATSVSSTNSDGANPVAGLILSGNTLYGTANVGGSSGNGTVFKLNTDGTGFTTLYSFTAIPGSPINSDGASPHGLILSGNTLYGTASFGGSDGNGTVFALNTDGTGFTNLHSFVGFPSDGVNPSAGLVLSNNTLYGTAQYGGSSGHGTVFALNTDGTGFTTLYSFTAIPGSPTNSDGANPFDGLILSGNTLYGTAKYGGNSGHGTVFALNTDGTGFTNLHSFVGFPSDGANPSAGLVLSNNTLYGTAQYGGSSGNGTAFAVHTDGAGFTNLHSFTATSGPSTNSDGAIPYAGLITNSSGTTLYGTSGAGGSSGHGTVFALNTDGTGFMTLYSFNYSEGPRAGLILSGNTLYGSGNGGTVFAINTNGTGFTTLHSFTGGDGGCPCSGLVLSGNILYGTAISGSSFFGTVFALHTDGTGFTNLHNFTRFSDGATPFAGLILSGNTLYGTAAFGGNSGDGTVFAVKTDGTGFTNLYVFTGSNDGSHPQGALILSGNTLYGTTQNGGGSGNNGTVFAVNANGTGFTNLHSFTATSGYTNSDGANPFDGLILSGNTLYGTAQYGGNSGHGTVFAVNTNGTGFTTLHSFTSDGAYPWSGLILSGNTLYGTAANGGGSGNGTIFSLSFRPQLSITPSGTNVILSWPTNVAGFDYTGYTLQSTTNLVSPAVWTTNSPAPVVVNGQNTVTNPISGTRKFYRLSQ